MIGLFIFQRISSEDIKDLLLQVDSISIKWQRDLQNNARKCRMKITDNVTVYAGINLQEESSRIISSKAENSKQKNNSTVFAGDLNEDVLQNRMMQRRKDAKEQAMKVISDAFTGDCTIDEDLEARRLRVKELEAENKELRDKIKDVDCQQEELMKKYGVSEDSEEYQNLELLRRGQSITSGALTPEERAKVAELRQNGLTEYQQRVLELDEIKEAYQETLNKNDRAILQENAIIRGTKLERLKYAPMTKAKEQAEGIMEAAGEEIKGMILEEAKDVLDEKEEEQEEQAEKIEEKSKEQEAFVEKQQEERAQEELWEEVPVEEMLDMEQMQTEVQKEIQGIVDKMKLVAEDIKGAAVDKSV